MMTEDTKTIAIVTNHRVASHISSRDDEPSRNSTTDSASSREDMRSHCSAQEIIVLNVGGHEFTTMRGTLTKSPVMSNILVDKNSIINNRKDGKGRYFLDRDGRLFSYILQYLRTGVLKFPDMLLDCDMLRLEAEFFSLDDLSNKLTEYCKRLRLQKDNHDIVKINVGGRIFVTTRRTMITYPNSLLARIFNGNQPNEYWYNGDIFFDRNPDLFSHILQFLRNKTLNYSCTSPESKDFLHNLLCEARFFKLQDLIGICMSLIRYCDRGGE